ncbi:MAG: hypothetical protein HYX78_03580 [Armatimonadetes bacterium]|nr:hypothetical protein [Armatimonadota bacterium]
MSLGQLFSFAVAIGTVTGAFATPTAETVPGAISVSASAHSISQGADAHSQIYDAHFGITNKFGVTAEAARISEGPGKTHIGSVHFRRPIVPVRPGKPLLAGYAGVMWLSVENQFGAKSEETGPSVGAVADLPVRPGISLYTRAGVAFLEEPLWTIDFGLRYELRPRWFLSLGYRSYDVDGSSLGGFLAGATYHL